MQDKSKQFLERFKAHVKHTKIRYVMWEYFPLTTITNFASPKVDF